MKFLVFGCNGMAGHLISLYLKEQGHQVTGFARTQSNYVDTIIGDAMNAVLVKNTVGVDKYDYIVNCIGVLNQFAECDKAKAVYLNSFFPHYLVGLTTNTNTRVIHLSTDCVFSGKRGHYTENDFRDGESFYDRTKALGEIEDEKNITLRQSIIGPDIKPSGIGLLNWFLQQQNEIYGFTNAIWTGLTTLQLAKVIELVAGEKLTGLYNMVPETSISKYDLLLLINRYIRKEKIRIIPCDNVAVDKSLIRTKEVENLIIPGYEDMIKEMNDWMQTHKSMYSHYLSI